MVISGEKRIFVPMNKGMPFCLILFISVFSPLLMVGQDSKLLLCPLVKIDVEQLSDLNIPRSGHQVFYAGGELMVAGGHTNGFVPTPTAEYYQDGKWHTMQMTYNHDFAISVVLKSGKVLLAGGLEQPTGIGQTFSAELYDPLTHTFRGFGNMQRKRAGASGLEIDSGQVVIAGNWYNDDGIELFQEKQSGMGDHSLRQSFTYIKDVAVQRSCPHIFRIEGNDVLIVGNCDTKGDTLLSTCAERLRGDSVHIPLFETWQPISPGDYNDVASFIGDETKNDYTYLLPVQDHTGQVAIARVCGTDINLLPTAYPVPMECMGKKICYSCIIADRQAGLAYLMGIDADYYTSPKIHHYILSIDYGHSSIDGGAPIMLYYTDPLPVVPSCSHVLTSDGNLLMAGGMINASNFTPSKHVYLFHVGRKPLNNHASISRWLVPLLILTSLLLICAFIFFKNKKRHQTASIEPEVSDTAKALMERIDKVMEEQKLYQNSELKLQDVANALGTNRRFISESINSQVGCSFSQFVNTYRIEHAKQLLRKNAGQKIADVYYESGFANETTFFRTFKSVTGMTPKEWLNKS